MAGSFSGLDRDHATSAQFLCESLHNLRDEIGNLCAIESLQAEANHRRASGCRNGENHVKICVQRNYGRLPLTGQFENLGVLGTGHSQLADMLASETISAQQPGSIARYALIED